MTLALFEVLLRNQPLVEFLVTALAKGNLVVRGVVTYLPALQMVDVKPDLFFLGCVCSTTLTGVVNLGLRFLASPLQIVRFGGGY